MASLEAEEISPVKWKQVTSRPLAPCSCCWETLFADCTLFILLIHPDHEPDEALVFRSVCGDPFGLVNEGLDKKHTHTASFFFACHFAVDVGGGGGRFDAYTVVHDLDLEFIGLH